MLGEALRLLRVFHDMKGNELAEKLGISQSYLSEIESGKKEPTLEIIRRYAKEFDTTSSSILFFSEGLPKGKVAGRTKRYLRGKIVEFLQRVENAQSFPISSK
jgi:transcriptional regulator with XRE-family HTH domain